jgi:glycine hydroxymethyltransferase
MKEPEMKKVANWICDVLANPTDKTVQEKVRGEVRELCKSFPAPSEIA